MTMSSYEVVRRAIEFQRPDRLPVRFPLLGMDDTHGVPWNNRGVGDRAKRQDYDWFGCLWERTEVSNMGQVTGHPLADLSQTDRYRWPDPSNPAFYEGMEARFEGSDDKYVTTGIGFFLFERMHMLHGFQNTLTDLYVERERMDWLADQVVAFNLGIIENIRSRFPTGIHGFGFTDDWGTELATFIRPAMWDDFFKPRYKVLFDAIHAAGWHVWMHSCGKVNGIIEGLIDIGCDVINLQQPRALGIEEMGRQFRGRICFESLCDIQHTLPFQDHEAIREEAALLLQEWGAPEGGFILSDYGDGDAIGVPPEKKQVMLEAFLETDPWRRAAQA
ncbi:MAG: uroporphyrinogen decarboxylase family protein [Anaerolineae bacterium]